MLKLNKIQYHPATAQDPVLRDINLEAFLGKPVIVAGISGSGKTSLLEIISGLSKPKKGEILWYNNKTNERQRRNLCGVVFQFPERHFLGLTVAQELRLGQRRLDGELQLEVLKKVGLSEVDLRQAPEKLSGGQQRRLAIGIQLLRKPSILLLDEPTAGLDWSVRNEILSLLANISNEQILIVVTHEPDLFQNWSISSYLLKDGMLIPKNELNSMFQFK